MIFPISDFPMAESSQITPGAAALFAGTRMITYEDG